MDELYEQIKAQIETLIAEGKALVADGLSWGDTWALLHKATTAIVGIIETIVDASGTDKKDLALYCIDKFYDEVVAPIDLPYIPNWLETRFVDPAVGKLVHTLAAQWIDTIIELFNRDGVPLPMTLEG